MTDNTCVLLAEKPERLLPLTTDQVASYRVVPKLAIGEIAGRDSSAAILMALESSDVGAILPVAVYTGTEHGDWRSYEQNVAFLRNAAHERFHKPVFDLVWLGSPRLWAALNGRYITEIVKRFGGYSPCLGCHFYLHAMRVPLAVQLGSSVLIGGDREDHDGRSKINQRAFVLDAYRCFLRRFGVEMWEPLRAFGHTADVDSILGDRWPGGSPQPHCLFSGNYHALKEPSGWTDTAVMSFIDSFIDPVLDSIVRDLLAGQSVDYVERAKQALQNRLAECSCQAQFG